MDLVESTSGVRGGGDREPPAVPPDYYRAINEVEDRHWWHRGMRAITEALLATRLERGGRLLDIGCGTGNFLAWARERGPFERVTGVDISAEAIELARTQAPDAELMVAPIWDLPLETDSFDLIVLNDVLQHVQEGRIGESLGEVRRVLRSGGALFVRTNGARRLRRDGEEWRVYDRRTLQTTLENAGFCLQRLTHANLAGSLVAGMRGKHVRAPTLEHHGVPLPSFKRMDALKYRLLVAESRYLRTPPRSIPYGNTLLTLATPDEGDEPAG